MKNITEIMETIPEIEDMAKQLFGEEPFTYFSEVKRLLKEEGSVRMLAQTDGQYTAITHDDVLAHFTDDGFLTDWNAPNDMPMEDSLERQRLFMLELDKVFVNLGLQSGEEVQGA
jgi:hypothetical protein